jgi:PAS domain S-box-containing protein
MSGVPHESGPGDGSAFESRAAVVADLDRSRHNEALLETVIAAAPVGLVFVDAELRVARVNDQALEQFGMRLEAFLGHPVADLVPRGSTVVEDYYLPVLRDGITIEDRRVTVHVGGVDRYLKMSHYPLRLADGPPVGVGVVIEDMTDFVQSERNLERLLKAESDARRRMEVAHRDVLARAEELRATQRRLLERTGLMRAIADMSQDPIFVVGRDLTYVVVNQAFARLLERPPERLIGLTHSAVLSSDLALLAQERDAQVLATGQASVHNETMELEDGVTRDFVTTRSPWLVDGEIAGVIGFARDVTERNPSDRMRDRRLAASQAAELSARATLERLVDQNRRLQELDRTKDDLLATISHDFRTPLTSIMGYTSLLLAAEGLDERRRRYVTVIDRNSARLLSLVEGLLLLAQHKAGAATQSRLVDIAAVARESVLSLSPLAEDKRVTLRCEQSGPAPIMGDPENLGRMVDNLVANAIKYVHEEGHVEVSLTRLDGWIVLKVRDNGPGIAPEKQAQIFDRFARAREAGTGGTPGFGLGLPIARAVAEAHGGTIGVDSSPGAGTTFWVRLPAPA